jgi:hypothetical protein
MMLRMVRGVVATLGAAGLVAMALAPRDRLSGPVMRPQAPVRPVQMQRTVRDVDSLARRVEAGDVFRAVRRPSAVSFDPAATETPGPPRADEPPPVFVVTGIVWGGGAEPAAIVDGVPGGRETAVVHQGDRLGRYVVDRIERERVWIVGPDGTLSLVIKEVRP